LNFLKNAQIGKNTAFYFQIERTFFQLRAVVAKNQAEKSDPLRSSSFIEILKADKLVSGQGLKCEKKF
jgi:hypothetical protein